MKDSDPILEELLGIKSTFRLVNFRRRRQNVNIWWPNYAGPTKSWSYIYDTRNYLKSFIYDMRQFIVRRLPKKRKKNVSQAHGGVAWQFPFPTICPPYIYEP